MGLLDLLFGLSMVDKASEIKKMPKGKKKSQAEDDLLFDAAVYDMMQKDNAKNMWNNNNKNGNGWL